MDNKKPYMVEFKEKLAQMKKVTAKMKREKLELLTEDGKSEYGVIRDDSIAKFNELFDQRVSATKHTATKYIRKFLDYARRIPEIPGVSVDKMIVKQETERVVPKLEMYLPFKHMAGKVPVEGVLALHCAADIYNTASDAPSIWLTACVGNPDEYPVWAQVQEGLGATMDSKKLPAIYQEKLERALAERLEAKKKYEERVAKETAERKIRERQEHARNHG